MRGIYFIIKRTSDFDRFLVLSLLDDTPVAPILMLFYFLLTDLIPIGSQLISTVVVVDSKDLHLDEFYNAYIEESTVIENNMSVKTVSAASSRAASKDGSEDMDLGSLVVINNSKTSGICFLSSSNDETSKSSFASVTSC